MYKSLNQIHVWYWPKALFVKPKIMFLNTIFHKTIWYAPLPRESRIFAQMSALEPNTEKKNTPYENEIEFS